MPGRNAPRPQVPPEVVQLEVNAAGQFLWNGEALADRAALEVRLREAALAEQPEVRARGPQGQVRAGRRGAHRRAARGVGEDRAGGHGAVRAVSAQDAARWLLMYGVMPLWIVAGLADWWCHRRTGIERTSGLRRASPGRLRRQRRRGRDPRVGVEHRHDGRDAIRLPRPEGVGQEHAHRVQERAAVAVHDTLGVARWCRSCSTCSPPCSRRPARTHRLGCLSSVSWSRGSCRQVEGRRSGPAPRPHPRCFTRQTSAATGQQAEQRMVDEDDLVVGVVDDVRELLGNKRMFKVCSTRPQHGAAK